MLPMSYLHHYLVRSFLFTGKDHKEEIPNKDLLRCGSLYLVFEYIEHDLGK